MYSNSTVSSHRTLITLSRPSPQSDPYNYTLNGELSRQSSINKLPGRKDTDLSSYPEMVILFQAAEIERLNTIISSQRIQNKGINKQHLDRHSYEIQIKQLTTIIDEFKQQNKGLKKRIQQLNSAVSSAESKIINTSDLTALANKYERALLEIGKMYDDNTKLQQEINQLHFQIATLKQKEKQQNISNVTKTTNYNNSISNKTVQIQSISEQYKNKLISQATRKLKQQINELQYRNSQTVLELRQSFSREMEEFKARMAQKNNLLNQQIEQQLNKANLKIQNLNAQIANINNQKWGLQNKLRQTDVKLREYEGKIRNHSAQVSKYIEQINMLNSRLSQIQNSGYFPQSPQNNVSLTLSKSRSKQAQESIANTHNKQSFSVNSSLNHNLYSQNQDNMRTMKTQQQLQNNVAMLSQQVQRLAELLKNKNAQVEQLQYQIKQQKSKIQMQMMNVRMKYQSDIRKEQQKRDDEQQRLNNEVQKYRRKVQQWQLSTAENTNKYREQLINIKEEQRKICEAVHEKKLKSLEQQYGRDREEITRLRNQLYSLHMQIDEMHQSEAQFRSRSKIEQLRYLQTIQQQQKKCEARIRNIEEEYSRREQSKYNQLKDKQQQQIAKLEKKLQQQAELIRQKQIEHVQQLQKISMKCQQNITKMRNEGRTLQQKYQRMILQKQRQLSHLSDVIKSNGHQNEQLSRKQHQILLRKLDILNQQANNAKNAILQTFSYTKNNSNNITEQQLSRISSSLSYLSTQITTLSKQIMEAHFQQQEHSLRQSTYYSEQYVKQLQNQCDNYLSIINGKMSNNDSVLKNIWQEIESNNRFNRQQQQKWRSTFIKQQQMLEKYQQEKYKWEQIRYQSQKIKFDFERFQQVMNEDNHKIKLNHLQQIQNIKSLNSQQIKRYNSKMQQLYSELNTKQNVIAEYATKLNSLSSQQNVQITKFMKIIQHKSKQLLTLSKSVEEYQNKYITTRDKLKSIQNIIQKILKDSENDLRNMQKLQQQNIQLRKQIQKVRRQLAQQGQEKTKIIQKSREQVRKIAHQLAQQSSYQQKQSINQQNDEHKNNKIRNLQKQFARLQEIIEHLRKDNYILTKQNYDGSTQDYVNRQFALTKIRQLNKQIERLMSQNIDLKDDVSRCRLQLAGEWNQERRYQENLSLMVLLFVEIQSLRKRLGNKD